MRRLLEVNSPPIMERTFISPFTNERERFSGFSMSDSEILVLSHIAIKQNPIEIFNLQHEEFTYPKITRVFCDNWIEDGIERYKEKTGKSRSFNLSYIKKMIKSLQKKGFVEKRSSPDADRMKKTVSITLPGLIYYLQLTGLNLIMQNLSKHENLMPFLKYWEDITKETPCAKEVLWKTIDNFNGVQEAEFLIDSFKFNFKSYLESDIRLWRKESTMLDMKYRNNILDNYLRNNEELRNSYIAYLALLDIRTLTRVANSEIKNYTPKLKSEQEFSLLEDKPLHSYPLFQGGLIKEFFPKYGSIEYFFTGLFLYNLIWGNLKEEIIHEDFNYQIKYVY
jgi:DNA-binding PadR family transcriptional regulator